LAKILGLGLTHYPGLAMRDRDMTLFLKRTLADGGVPPALRDPARWPEPMRREWGDDDGATAAAEHRRRSVAALRTLRGALDQFKPDVVMIFGDDQYENFIEDIVPPFCLYLTDRMESRPFGTESEALLRTNIWGEPQDKVFVHAGHPGIGRFLANRLNELGVDLPYAYRLRYRYGLAHAFINTLLYLDYDRTGFPYPVLPLHVNCYGSEIIRRRGGMLGAGDAAGELDPPAPSARSCFDVGRAIARAFVPSPYRVALIASSSWSHAFLTAKNYWLYPDHDSDRTRLAELTGHRFSAWRNLGREEIEAAGEHEFLNWVVLAGAMAEIGARVRIVDYLESYVLNSNKCFAVFSNNGEPS
jgi:hypothetical protein